MCSPPKGNKLQSWERWLKEPVCLRRGWWKESVWNSQREMIWTIVAGEGVRYRGQRCRVWSQVTPVGHGFQRNGSSIAQELITQSTEESRAVWNGPKALFFFHLSALLLSTSDERSCHIVLAFWLVGRNWEKLLLSPVLLQRALLQKYNISWMEIQTLETAVIFPTKIVETARVLSCLPVGFSEL